MITAGHTLFAVASVDVLFNQKLLLWNKNYQRKKPKKSICSNNAIKACNFIICSIYVPVMLNKMLIIRSLTFFFPFLVSFRASRSNTSWITWIGLDSWWVSLWSRCLFLCSSQPVSNGVFSPPTELHPEQAGHFVCEEGDERDRGARLCHQKDPLQDGGRRRSEVAEAEVVPVFRRDHVDTLHGVFVGVRPGTSTFKHTCGTYVL